MLMLRYVVLCRIYYNNYGIQTCCTLFLLNKVAQHLKITLTRVENILLKYIRLAPVTKSTYVIMFHAYRHIVR